MRASSSDSGVCSQVATTGMSIGVASDMSDISMSLYNSLLGSPSEDVGTASSPAMREATADASAQRQVHLPSAGTYITGNFPETPPYEQTAGGERGLATLTRRIADLFEQKQELVAELKSERLKSEQMAAERDELRASHNELQEELDQALEQVDQTRVARERVIQFMDDAKAATMRVISESRVKVTAAEDAAAEAERSYQDEHNLRRSLEQMLQEATEHETELDRTNADLRDDLAAVTKERDELENKLSAAESNVLTLQNEAEAHLSRIDHLTSRNELLARNLQNASAESKTARQQFEETSVKYAALSADYESLMRRCEDAEAERDELQAQSLNRAASMSVVSEEMASKEIGPLRDELSSARDVIGLLRPIIEKAETGNLRKGDIRLLGEVLAEYESVAAHVTGVEGSSDSYAEADMSQTEVGTMIPNETSFMSMFGQGASAPTADTTTEWNNGYGEFDDLDEPNLFDDASFEKSSDVADDGQEKSDLFEQDGSFSYEAAYADVMSRPTPPHIIDAGSGEDDEDKESQLAFPEDLMRSEESTDSMASDLGIDMTDINAIFSDFAHFNEQRAEH